MSDARTLLSRYAAHALLSEHAAWEAVRGSTRAARYAAPDEGTARTIVALDGIPGAGKSTTLRWLQPALGADYLSMARFAQARGVSSQERLAWQLQTGRPHAVDEAFLRDLEARDARWTLLEKFPRTVVEAAALLEAAGRHRWRFVVLHLELPGDCVALSVQRQLERGPRRGQLPEPNHARERALVHLARATSARELLRAHGVPIAGVDMTRPLAQNAAAIRRALGLDVAALPWHLPPLEVLERVAARLGVEAWVSSGSVYRPFWNGRFGPMQLPTDVDVAVERQADAPALLAALDREAPRERWSVLSPSARLLEREGVTTSSAVEAKRHAAWLHRAGLARLRRGDLEVVLPDGAEACLWSGLLRLNPLASESARRAALHHALRALADYPGLRVDGGLAHAPRRVGGGFRALKALAPARAQRGQAHCRRSLTPPEHRIAVEILHFHRQSGFAAEAPPLPPRSRVSRREGLAEYARDAGDAEFAQWFLDQVHHHRPLGGADAYLRSVLDGSLLAARLRGARLEQGAMHQGWTLPRHLAQSVLQLQTDDLLDRLGKTHCAQWRSELRLCMRLAMLFHDTGKLAGDRPRRHSEISARLFARFCPPWFPRRLMPMTCWLIRTHDLFGALARCLTDKRGRAPADYAVEPEAPTSYYGGLDSQAARRLLLEAGLPLSEATAINRAIWCADVGSIAALRWLLPVAALVEQLILVRSPGAPWGGVERRRR